MVKEIFTFKFKEWEYENEVRLLTSKKYITNINITAIYRGLGTTEIYKEILMRISDDIPIYTTRINQHNLVVPVFN